MRTFLAASLFALVASSCSHSSPKPAEAPSVEAPPAESAAPATDPAAPAAAPPAATPDPRAWIARSNANAQLLLQVQARFQPEFASRMGIPGLDEQISDFTPGHNERVREALRQAQAELEKRLAAEKDVKVAQDLQILIDACKEQIEGSELEERLVVPYFNLPQLMFGSMRALLEPQVAAERRPAALVRMRKYLGMEGGNPSVVQLAMAETREGLKKKLLAPALLEVENHLETAAPLIEGVAKLFEEFKIAGHEPVVAELRKQLAEYLAFVRKEVLPKARKDYRLPRELYAYNLKQVGVDIAPEELATIARKEFAAIQGEMQKVAAQIAKERGWKDGDYRAVIKQLKKAQIPDDKILDLYKQRLTEIEGIIREHKLVTLPARPARIRLGTPAESAAQPAPHMVPPRMIGNTGEQGEFVLPLSVPGKVAKKYDDFNFDAAAWTLTAHEARPGHEMQFSRIIDTGVSLSRALFAFNSVNAEGWALYSEAITLPYMPLDGQLISLQLRLQRAARAFVDPEIQLTKKWTPASARAFLQREVGLSEAFATEEVDRFTFRMPAQATAYYYGYMKILELRKAAEAKLGARFDPLTFHDAILAQGMLPPDLMSKAVLDDLK